MKRLKVVLFVVCFLSSSPLMAMFADDPWLTKVMSEFEYLQEEGDGVLEWDIDAWRGQDLRKFWLKSSGEYSSSEFEGANIELVYSRAVTAYWDQQFGLRRDIESDSELDERTWASFGYIGTAPYFVQVDARVFIGEESSSQLLIELERELMITQEWVLTPELDIIANGRSNAQFDEGAGLAEVEFSLRLGYEHDGNRKFQPFIGLTSSRKFGATKRLAESEGKAASKTELMIGIHSWF